MELVYVALAPCMVGFTGVMKSCPLTVARVAWPPLRGTAEVEDPKCPQPSRGQQECRVLGGTGGHRRATCSDGAGSPSQAQRTLGCQAEIWSQGFIWFSLQKLKIRSFI